MRSAPLDEMVDGRGGLRPHWRGVLGVLTSLGDGGLRKRARRLDRAFEEEGVTSFLPGASAAEGAWRCDPVPLPLGADEFAELEAGLAQRASLLEAILADLYGRQELLAEGVLPPALVFPNPGFLRPCCDGPSEAGGDRRVRLHFYAADLVRGPDGSWRVLADRTAGAGGVGYARENRRLLARVLPEVFRPVQVRQLRPFFDRWQDALQRLGPPDAAGVAKPNPTVALLTPGNSHPRWFEHMFLSRELSCALVEGGDLTVRGGVVFLKTLKGLRQVDVLLRRVGGRLIDPLELDAGSHVGVPGLLDAVRSGSVRIVNEPGSALVEAPALAAFLPALCMRLLGERLRAASIPTMWLGESRARELLEQDVSRWLIRPALDGTAPAISLAAVEPGERAALMQKVAARPWEWAASANLPPSVAPCLAYAAQEGSGLAPKPVVLRLFLINDGERWRAMEGGLARVMDDGERLAGRLPGRGLSKDVWVLNEERTAIVGPPLVAVAPLRLRRTTGDLPSRIADNLFWLGRYVERLERAARLVRAAVTRLARGATLLPRELADLGVIAHCLADAGLMTAEAAGSPAASTMANALLATVRDGGSIDTRFASVARLTENVRDQLTGDMYGTFTATLRAARADAAAAGRSLDGLAHAMVTVLRFSTAVAGVAAENMVRGGGWLFLELGRRVERAQAVATEVARALDKAPAHIETGLRLVLELCDSAITYRSRYLNVLQPAPVLDLVLADQGNPRGLAFQLFAMHGLLEELAGESVTGGESPTIEVLGRERLAGTAAGLLAEVEMMVEAVLAAEDQAAAAASLPAKLQAVAAGTAALSDRIARRYFALLPAVHTVGWVGDASELRGAA
jgi:uncharacterized circularly permuted ATP-grasp superfamily protein/uncharacterized alpha-E superfamily protein